MKFVEITFTGSVLQSGGLDDPARPPAMVGPGYTGGRWYQISHAIQVRRFILHLGDAHSKQWAALNASTLWAYLVDALDNIHEVHLWLIYRN